MECAPQLGSHKQILPPDEAGVNGILDALSDLLFVLVAAGTIDVTVASLDGMEDGSFYFTGGGLPSSYTESERAGNNDVRYRIPSPKAGISAPVLSLNRTSAAAVIVSI